MNTTYKLTEGKRTQRNLFHLHDDLRDMMYSSPNYTIEEEEGEILRYRRTRISFNTLHSTESNSWLSPDVDSIDLISFYAKDRDLFTSLLERGYSSVYINYFAQCERHKSPYKDISLKNTLLKRTTQRNRKDTPDETENYFHLNGGSLIFHRLLELDPDFWREILRACRETDLLKIRQLHLCADCDQDIMEYVSNSIKEGHYESNGLRPYGIYYVGGKKEKGPVGKESGAANIFKKTDFRLQTLYFGDKRSQPVSISLYDKKAESMERRGAVAHCKSRIEIRFNTRVANGAPHTLLETILATYSSKGGCSLRARIFLHFLKNTVRFTNHATKIEDEDMALWWRHQVISPLYHVGIEVNPTDLNNYISGAKVLTFLPEYTEPQYTRKKRGRPPGSKDKKPRKRKDVKTDDTGPIIDV